MQECLLILSKAEKVNEMSLWDLKKKLGFEGDFWPIHAYKLDEHGDDFFSSSELLELAGAEYKWVILVECYLDEIDRIRPLLRAILIQVEGVVMYSSFAERYTPAELDRFKPSLD